MTDGVSLTLLAYIFYLLVEPFFSTIFFRVFVSHKLLMVLYICLLIFRTSLMISLTVVKILVVYPRLMLGREGGDACTTVKSDITDTLYHKIKAT